MKLPYSIFEGSEGNRMEVGVIGAGKISERTHIPILLEYSKTTIKYIADIDISRANKLAKICGCDSVDVNGGVEELPECDIALLAIPVGVRRPYIEEFSRRGTAIFVEKPFAKNIEEHQEYIELNSKMICNYMRTWFSSTRQMKEIVCSEIFGPLKSVKIKEGLVNSTGIGKSHYRNNIKMAGGGVLMESGCHTISQIVEILNGYKIEVKNSDIKWEGELDIAVDIVMVASKNTDVEVKYEASRIEPFESRAIFEFQNARVEFDHTGSGEVIEVHTNEEGDYFTIEPGKYSTSFVEGVFLRWAEFIQQIWSGEEIDVNRMTSVEVTKIITEIYKKGNKGEVR